MKPLVPDGTYYLGGLDPACGLSEVLYPIYVSNAKRGATGSVSQFACCSEKVLLGPLSGAPPVALDGSYYRLLPPGGSIDPRHGIFPPRYRRLPPRRIRRHDTDQYAS